MTQKEMTLILKMLSEAYQNFELSEAKFQVWYELLGDLDFEVVKIAVETLVLQSSFVPTIADIRKKVLEITNPIPDASEAFLEVREAIKKYGHEGGSLALKHMSPLTAEVCKRIGWRNICLSENPEAIREQFFSLYSELRDKAEKDLLVPKHIKQKTLALKEGQKSLGGGL
ncbi:MAG: replicative helicase loader/inhibitor [Caldisericum sp.]